MASTEPESSSIPQAGADEASPTDLDEVVQIQRGEGPVGSVVEPGSPPEPTAPVPAPTPPTPTPPTPTPPTPTPPTPPPPGPGPESVPGSEPMPDIEVIPQGGSTLPVSEEQLQEWDPMPDELIEGGAVEPLDDPMAGGAPTG